MPTNILDLIPAGKAKSSLSCLSTFNQTISFKTNYDCIARMLYLMSEYPTSVSLEARDKTGEVLAFILEDISQDDLRPQNEGYVLKDEAVERIFAKIKESCK